VPPPEVPRRCPRGNSRRPRSMRGWPQHPCLTPASPGVSQPLGGAGMTTVRQRAEVRRTFIRKAQEHVSTHDRLPNTTRHGEDSLGRSVPPQWLDTSVFSRPQRKASAARVAAALSIGAGVSRRRVLADLQLTMQEHSDEAFENRDEPRGNHSFTSFTLRPRTEVNEIIARRRSGNTARSLRSLRSQTKDCHTRGTVCPSIILPSQNEVNEVNKKGVTPSRPRKISFTSKIEAKCTKCTSAAAAGGVVHE